MRANFEAIDVVYLWCDGSDPQFKKEKELLLKNLNQVHDESVDGDIRFSDNCELKYSLRSVNQNLPWVNHIYIVTNRQRPAWLVQSNRVTIVDHTEIIPNNLLPTFNSVMIEMYIDKIPGLAEKFLFFNDDMFVNHKLLPEFFFERNKPIVRLVKDFKRWQFTSFDDALLAFYNPKTSSYRKSLIYAWMLFCSRHGLSNFYMCTHNVDSFTKTMYRDIKKIYPELLSHNNTPFRSDKNIQRVIFQMEMAKTQGCPLKIESGLSFIQKRLPSLFRGKVNFFEGTESEKTWERIRKIEPKLFCLNSASGADGQVKQRSRQLLDELFPTQSPFECV